MIPTLLDFRFLSHLMTPSDVTCFLIPISTLPTSPGLYLDPGSAGTCLNTNSSCWPSAYYTPEVPDGVFTDISFHLPNNLMK